MRPIGVNNNDVIVHVRADGDYLVGVGKGAHKRPSIKKVTEKTPKETGLIPFATGYSQVTVQGVV